MPTFDDLSWPSLDAPRPEWQHLPPDITGPTFKHIGERVTPLHAIKRASFHDVEKIAFTRFGLERDRQSFIGRLETTFSDAMGALADGLKSLGLGLTRFGGNVALQGAKLALIGGLVFGGAHIASPPAPAHAAADIVVDDPDGDLINVNNLCSLSEAIINANNDALTYADCAPTSGSFVIGAADTITLDTDVTFDAISGPILTGAPAIASEITLQGNGNRVARVVSGPGLRLFSVSPGATFTIDNTIVQFGDVGTSPGGNILNSGTLTLQNSTNVQDSGGAIAGGGIFNDGGTVVVQSYSRVQYNSATRGGGIYNDGGDVTINNARVQENTGGLDGGGIYMTSGTLTIQNSAYLNDNSAINRHGGGIFIRTGTLTVDNASVDDNFADGRGGGIYAYDASVDVLNGASVDSNDSNDDGGGIYIRADTLTVDNASVNSNFTNSSGGGIDTYGTATVIIQNTASVNSRLYRE